MLTDLIHLTMNALFTLLVLIAAALAILAVVAVGEFVLNTILGFWS